MIELYLRLYPIQKCTVLSLTSIRRFSLDRMPILLNLSESTNEPLLGNIYHFFFDHFKKIMIIEICFIVLLCAVGISYGFVSRVLFF